MKLVGDDIRMMIQVSIDNHPPFELALARSVYCIPVDQFMAMSGLSIWLQHHHRCSSSPLPLLMQNPLHAQTECVHGKLQVKFFSTLK
ncbi:hypothetical protein CsSME_00007425 [Camellia sinensis var. sinensis]